MCNPEAKAGEPAISYHCRRCDARHGTHMFLPNGECRSRSFAPSVGRERVVAPAHGDQQPPRPLFKRAPQPPEPHEPALPEWAERIRRARRMPRRRP